MFKAIKDWNVERGLIEYSPRLEFRLLMEELLESALMTNAKEYAVYFTGNISDSLDAIPVHKTSGSIADAYGDIIFVAVGSLWKLGYDPSIVLQNVIDANNNKGNKKDPDGKIIKEEGFDHPEHDNAKTENK
jgi:predicted HAD superfamily Cof-like phosphohydrolase